MDKPVGFVVIGTGVIAKFHIAAIRAIPEARLLGVCGSSPARSAQAARSYDTKGYPTLADVWADPEVEAVCICTPSGHHEAMALEAIHHRRHVLIEKPMALTIAGCDAIITAARERQVLAGVVSQFRFSPAVAQIQKALARNQLGKLVSVDLYMKYFRSQEYYDSAAWRGTYAMDGGALMNQGIHGVDLLQYLAGPLTSIYARAKTLVRSMEAEDTLAAVTEFENGAIGVIQATTSVYPGFPRRLELCGEKGVIVLEENRIALWDIQGESPSREDTQDAPRISSSSRPDQIGLAGHEKQLANFTAAILGREPLLIDGAEGRKAVNIVLSAYESAREGRPVTF